MTKVDFRSATPKATLDALVSTETLPVDDLRAMLMNVLERIASHEEDRDDLALAFKMFDEQVGMSSP